MKLRFVCALLAAAGLAGCATPSFTTDQAGSVTSNRASAAIEEFQKARPGGVVREIDEPSVDFTKTTAPRIRGDVNINAKAAPFAPILSEIAKKAGYSVAFGDMVDLTRKVTIDYTDAVAEDAIRITAFQAGYAAVFDKQNRTIYISDVATYTFRLPAGVFSALQAQYNVGGNPANAGGSSGGGSGSSGGGSGGSSGGTSLKAEFNVTGREGGNPNGLTKYLQDLAGKNAEVIVTDNGIISVRANAQALKRVHEFMKTFAKDAMTQVEIEASVVEVSLANEFSVGIQWGKVVNRATSSGGAVLGGAGAVTQAMTDPTNAFSTLVNQAGSTGMGAFRVGASTTSIINALAQFTDVKVVSQPRLLSMNNVPATFFDGTQIPYLGSVQQTQGTGVGTQPTVTGSVAFAIDGVSFSAVPSVVDGSTVQITLVPVLSNVQGFSTFLNGQLTAPTQANKQTFMRVLAESNKTLILGGIRYSVDSKDTALVTSTSKKSSAKEIVILLRANVVAPPNFDPIVNEAL